MVIVSMLLLTRLKGGRSGKGWININHLDLTSHSLILHQCREHVQAFAMIKAAFARIKGGTRLIVTRWSLQNDLSMPLSSVFEAHTLLSRLRLRPNKISNFTGEGHCHIRISPILR